MPMQNGVNKAQSPESTDGKSLLDLTWSPSLGMALAARRGQSRLEQGRHPDPDPQPRLAGC